jgi:hypothetical protein
MTDHNSAEWKAENARLAQKYGCGIGLESGRWYSRASMDGIPRSVTDALVDKSLRGVLAAAYYVIRAAKTTDATQYPHLHDSIKAFEETYLKEVEERD